MYWRLEICLLFAFVFDSGSLSWSPSQALHLQQSVSALEKHWTRRNLSAAENIMVTRYEDIDTEAASRSRRQSGFCMLNKYTVGQTWC
jgi:hypothetical protein